MKLPALTGIRKLENVLIRPTSIILNNVRVIKCCQCFYFSFSTVFFAVMLSQNNNHNNNNNKKPLLLTIGPKAAVYKIN